MQIILISSRTLGASELLLPLSLFSRLFFSLLFVFLPLLLLFLKPFSIPPSISSSSPSLPFVSLLSPPLCFWSLHLCLVVLSSLRSRPGLTLCGCPMQRRVTGRFGRSGGWGAGGLGFWCHFLASQSDVSWSQALSVKSGVVKKK